MKFAVHFDFTGSYLVQVRIVQFSVLKFCALSFYDVHVCVQRIIITFQFSF